MFLIGQELRQGPKGVLFVHEHEQQGGDLTHPLAVTHLLQASGQKDKHTPFLPCLGSSFS